MDTAKVNKNVLSEDFFNFDQGLAHSQMINNQQPSDIYDDIDKMFDFERPTVPVEA